MDPLETSSAASSSGVRGTYTKRRLKMKILNTLALRRNRVDDYSTTQFSEDDSRNAGPSPPRRETQIFVDLQKSYIRNYTTEPAAFHSKLDDICRYGLSVAQKSDLWLLETNRLAAALETDITQNPLKPIIAEEWVPDYAGFKLLSRVASEIVQNIAVCDFDNKLVFFNCQPESCEKKELSLARSAILEGQQKKAREGHTEERAEASFAASARQRREFYCALVDYVTATAARLAAHNFADSSWYAHCMASLARFAAKLKFLAIDPEGFASQSLENEQQDLASGFRHADKLDTSNFSRTFSASSWALQNVLNIFRDLNFGEKGEFWNKTFTIAAVVYKTGWRHVPIMLSENQYGEVSGTSARSATGNAKGAFDILDQVSRKIDVKPAAPFSDPWKGPPTGLYGSGRVWMRLKYRDMPAMHSCYTFDPDPKEGDLETLADVLSFLIPLLFMQPKRLLQVNRHSGLVTEAPIGSENTPEPFYRTSRTNFSASVDLSFCVIGPDPQPSISRTLQLMEYPHPLNVCPNLIRTLEHLRSIDTIPTGPNRLERTQGWAIEETAIVVKRRVYVTTTMTACGILVVGGILAGLLLGERIPGVDPFNIATFTWVLAAFIIVIAKSLSVREWPWHDFLRGQVPCRSVSELHTVTGIDEQHILRYLLANDTYKSLTTRGPFNLFFTRRSEDGFSIDVKMELRTLLFSGIVVVRVATHMGHALVCLDLRRGVEGRTEIRHFDGPREGERMLGCFDFPEDIDSEADVQLHRLSRSMTWTRIAGAFLDLNKKFG